MKSIITFNILLLLCFYTNAQPGYQGKKIAIQYNGLIGPRSSNPSFNQKAGLGINYTHAFGIDYTISRKHTIGLTFSAFKTSISEERNGDDNYLPSILKLYSYGAEFNIKFGSKRTGLIAPIGFYQMVGIGIWLNQLKDNTNTLDLSTIPVTKFTDFSFSYGFGKRMVYFDRLVLDLGVNLSLSKNIFTYAGDPLERTEDGTSYIEEDIDFVKSFSQGRFSNHIFINFKAGIGFLL